ncbi:MAG: type IV toxin-antitoxin system AbiEi family antitoxin domain-containing protein [Gammaproteobacteria bacterium]|nr:type IV toxin-antitoxin system AbiEi family antitoxin domain-containing protein [Gammaproteobacteria bacterium]
MAQRGGSVPRKYQSIRLIQEQGGPIRTGEALKAGIHPRTLYQLRDEGILVVVSRGVYRLADAPPLSSPDLVTVALRAPQAVVCLVSALAFQEMTTQIPHAVAVALPKGAEAPRIAHPPISVHRFSGHSFIAGIETHRIDGVAVRVYGPEKTLADCFRFRNRLGMDVVLEALKFYKARKPFRVDDLLKYARICRVERVMRPYLETLV